MVDRSVVMLTFTGASSRVAPGRMLSKVMVTGTVGVDEPPDPPDEHGDWAADRCRCFAAWAARPLPTVSM